MSDLLGNRNCLFSRAKAQILFCCYRSKTYLFEEFLSSWYEKLKERETTTMTVRLHKDIETYKAGK